MLPGRHDDDDDDRMSHFGLNSISHPCSFILHQHFFTSSLRKISDFTNVIYKKKEVPWSSSHWQRK